MDPARRKLLFASLYLSEGGPIGFIWLALPTQLRKAELPVEQIGWLMAILVLPWTFKFAWAPLIDLLQGERWKLRQWIYASQSVMGLTLIPLLFLDPVKDFSLLSQLLLVHAFSAATQDVAIDALCISVTTPLERGSYNGWMQTGMLTGRALMGGGGLLMAPMIGNGGVVGLLIGLTTFSMVLLWWAPQELLKPWQDEETAGAGARIREAGEKLVEALGSLRTWTGLGFALLGGAAFKSVEVMYGPFLVDRGYTTEEVGGFAALPMIGLMIGGSLLGGRLADRAGRKIGVGGALVFIACCVACLAIGDRVMNEARGVHLLIPLAGMAFGIGVFTAASYALFMDLTEPRIAATQFSAYMGATNGCESWSSYTIGILTASYGYSTGMLAMAGLSLLGLIALGLTPDQRHKIEGERLFNEGGSGEN
ncbi:MAG: MFS transporter [Planctomycetaceae bacterium]|nr:MFS transporter [Planctomycetaceae bacterium]